MTESFNDDELRRKIKRRGELATVAWWIILVVGLMWLFSVDEWLYRKWLFASERSGYTLQSFQVETVYKVGGGVRRGETRYVAAGRIAGSIEKLDIGEHHPSLVGDLNTYQTHYPPGTEIKVWFNPSLDPSPMYAHTQRVLSANAHQDPAIRNAILSTISGAGPLAFGVIGLVAHTVRARRRNAQAVKRRVAHVPFDTRTNGQAG